MACSGGTPPARPIDAYVPPLVDAPGPRCDPAQPFGAQIPLASLNTAGDDVCPRLTPDELVIVFSRLNSDDTYDLFEASRAKITDPFGAAQLLGTVNSIYSDVWPSISPDQLSLYFMSDRASPGTYRIWVSTRAVATDPFGPPAIVSALMNNDVYPFVTSTGTALYFSSNSRPDTTGLSDLYRASLDGSGNVGTPAVLVGGVNTTANELVPVVTGDELTIYFCRTNATDCDIYSATRASSTDPWGTAIALPGESTTGIQEVAGWVSPDGCDLYLYNNGSGGSGGEDLYELVRPAP